MAAGATVVAGTVVGGAVVGGTVEAGTVVRGTVVGGTVVGGAVVGGAVVGGAVVGTGLGLLIALLLLAVPTAGADDITDELQIANIESIGIAAGGGADTIILRGSGPTDRRST